MMKRGWLAGLLLLSLAASPSRAGVILSPVSVLANSMGTGAGSPAHLIDQSGLSIGFFSGETDFDTYIAEAPVHAGLAANNGWASFLHNTSGHLDFDLGNDYTLFQFALWSQNNNGAVNSFSLISAVDAGFTTGVTTLISATAQKGLGAQTFAISGQAEFIRLQINTDFGSPNVNIGEIAFDVEPVSEPAGLALLLAGIAVLAVARPRSAPATNGLAPG